MLRYALPVVLLLGAVAYTAAHLWTFAVLFMVLATSSTWRTRRRLDGASSEVTAPGPHRPHP